MKFIQHTTSVHLLLQLCITENHTRLSFQNTQLFLKKVSRVVLNLFFWSCAICTLGSLAMIFYSAHFIVRHSFQYYQYVEVKCQRPWHLLKVNFYLKMRQAEAK